MKLHLHIDKTMNTKVIYTIIKTWIFIDAMWFFKETMGTNAGGEKICRADWVPEKGFTPIAETISGNEYVIEWCKSLKKNT